MNNIFALLLVGAIAITAAFGFNSLDDKADRTNKRLVATMNCVQNTAYKRSQFDQCIQDYYDSRGW